MFISRKNRFDKLFSLFAVIILYTSMDVSDAKGFKGRGFSGRRSSKPSSSHRYSPPVHHPSPVYHPPVHHPPLPPVHHIPSVQHSQPSAPHLPVSNSKVSSNSFIHNEGGGYPSPNPVSKQNSGGMPKPHNPGSAPSAPFSDTHPSGMPQPSRPGSAAPYPSSHPNGIPKFTNQNTPIGFDLGHSKNQIHQPSYGPPPVYGAPLGSHGGYGPPPPYSGSSYGSPPNYHPNGGHPAYAHPLPYTPAAQPFVPGQSTIILPVQTTGRGIGEIAKEALVFSTINAGVNRLFNGPSHSWHHGYHDYGHGPTSTMTNNTTTIINNNYGPHYASSNNPSGFHFPPSNGNDTNQNNTQQGDLKNITSPEQVMSFNYSISEKELFNLTEKLFSIYGMNQKRNYILNLQKKVSNISDVTDEAMQSMFYVDYLSYKRPTIKALHDMFLTYEFNATKKEADNIYWQTKQDTLINTFVNTSIMTTAMKWLQEKLFIESDELQVKNTVKRIWFNKIDEYTSGFERIFMAEWYPGPTLLGAQNWVYFQYAEKENKINYLSYVDKVEIGHDKITLVKMNIEMAGVTKPNVTMMIGSPPELEMALYTVCYYARPNDMCPISLGGVQFYLYTHSCQYLGNSLMDLGLIAF